MSRKISITEALNELKLYDSKINKAISNAAFVGAAKKVSDMIGVQKKTVFAENAKSAYQSITDLISNRNTLKSLIVKSNATTNVTINEKTMTVAEAIERKSSILFERTLLNTMKKQYSDSSSTMNLANRKVDNMVEDMIKSYLGKDTDKKVTEVEISVIERPIRDNNEFALVDSLGIYDKILALESEIDGFESNVNTILVLSNATTFIEVDF